MSDKERSIEQVRRYMRAAWSVGHTATAYREENGKTNLLLHDDLLNVLKRLEEVQAERDAALAAVEHVRVLAYQHRSVEQHNEMVPVTDTADLIREPSSADYLAALDGAPEPEGRWEYRGHLQSCGYVAEGYISAEHAMNGLKVELEDHPYLKMDDTAIVERARVREWLPVEGEGKP